MKKNILIIFLGVFTIASLAMFAGCKKAETNLKFATGGTAGTYYPYGMELAKIFNSKIPGLNVLVQSTGASIENIGLVRDKKADIAIVQNDVSSYAFDGVRLFDGEPVKGIATIATLYMEVVQIAVSSESKINSIKDMKGKRISVGDAGSGGEANAEQILAASNLTFNDIAVKHLSFKDTGHAFQIGEIDGFFITSGIPNVAIQDIAETKSIKILPIGQQEINQLISEYSFYIPHRIQKDAYKGVTADVPTVAVKASLIVRADLDEKIVYEMTKAMFENRAEITKATEKGRELDISEAIKGISTPLHPGARKYYTEKGVLK